jgi:GNAT superfamily N-acetyltransferase
MAVGDIPDAFRLMQALAAYEGYERELALTEDRLADAAGMEPPPFKAFVVGPEGGPLAGLAVTVTIPWTYTLRPTLVLKELYTRPAFRGTGTGRALFGAVRDHARVIGAGQIDWLVLPSNTGAKAFYRQMGGRPDTAWERWCLPLG